MHLTHARTARIETRLSPEADPEFQIAPMIDILLVLLVFFMSISSTEVLQKTHALQLPVAEGTARPAIAPGQVIVNISWVPIQNTGSIAVDGVTYQSAAELVPVLQKALNTNPHARVLIRADKNVRYDFLRPVMIAAGKAGVGNVTFSVVNREAP